MSAEKPSTVEVYQVLCEIRDYMKSLDVTMLHILSLTEKRMSAAKPTNNGATIATDADLDSQYGNPIIVAKDPRDWSGESMNGRTFSACPPEYLDMVADRLDYFNDQLGTSDEDQKKRKYNRLDAARARGWARRLRAGWTPPQLTAPEASHANPFTDEDVSF